MLIKVAMAGGAKVKEFCQLYIKSAEQSDSGTLGTLDHFSHFTLIGFVINSPFQG